MKKNKKEKRAKWRKKPCGLRFGKKKFKLLTNKKNGRNI